MLLEIINENLCTIWLYLIKCPVYIFTYILYMTNTKYMNLSMYFQQALEKHTIILFISFLCTYTISCHSKSNLVKKASVPLWIYVWNYICTSEILNTHKSIHLVFSTCCQHKYNWILCTKKPVSNASFQDFWCTNINNHLICFKNLQWRTF